MEEHGYKNWQLGGVCDRSFALKDDVVLKPKGEFTYEDVIRSFGGRFVGESQVLPGDCYRTGSEDDGVLKESK